MSETYKLNEVWVESRFEQSIDVTISSMLLIPNIVHCGLVGATADNKQTIAAIIAFAEWIIGVGILIPFHRIYLGVEGQYVNVIGLYCITLGGCGLLPLLDGIFLLADNSGSKYIENPKFIMWAGN